MPLTAPSTAICRQNAIFCSSRPVKYASHICMPASRPSELCLPATRGGPDAGASMPLVALVSEPATVAIPVCLRKFLRPVFIVATTISAARAELRGRRGSFFLYGDGSIFSGDRPISVETRCWGCFPDAAGILFWTDHASCNLLNENASSARSQGNALFRQWFCTCNSGERNIHA